MKLAVGLAMIVVGLFLCGVIFMFAGGVEGIPPVTEAPLIVRTAAVVVGASGIVLMTLGVSLMLDWLEELDNP